MNRHFVINIKPMDLNIYCSGPFKLKRGLHDWNKFKQPNT